MSPNRMVRPFILFCCSILMLTSCAPFTDQPRPQIQSAPAGTSSAIYVDNKEIVNGVPVNTSQGKTWLPIRQAAEAMDFSSDWDEPNQTYQMGYTDPLFTVKVGQTQAQVEEETVQLPAAPQLINGQVYITVDSLAALWNTEVSWDALNKKISIRSIDDSDMPDGEMAIQSQGPRTFALPNINKQNLVRTATRYKGVPYRFGTGPYPQTRRFDCSSFTKYVYSKSGVALPRTSRSQAKKGVRVSLSNIQPGDLLFFYTPGRYRTNRIVGHVGMYIGNGKMIHTYGEPGVTTDSIYGYWRSRLLFAKRVAK
jgi:cell wall-associated NlpC family hydrolase